MPRITITGNYLLGGFRQLHLIVKTPQAVANLNVFQHVETQAKVGGNVKRVKSKKETEKDIEIEKENVRERSLGALKRGGREGDGVLH